MNTPIFDDITGLWVVKLEIRNKIFAAYFETKEQAQEYIDNYKKRTD